METILLNKPRSMTPLQAINQLKKLHPELLTKKISYAGRLDPMAQGLLILLVDEENKNRHKYENLPKTYEFSILFGVNTDTYDTLGKISESKKVSKNIEDEVKKNISSYLGDRSQEYPPYSSRTIDGKPMYFLARNNLLTDKIIPTKMIQILELSFLKSETVLAVTLAKSIIADIEKVEGDFRQGEIIQDWKEWSREYEGETFMLVSLRATVTSGTYIRSLVNTIGKDLSTPAIAYSIIRTGVGDFNLSSAQTI